MTTPKFGIQLYSVRKTLATDFDGTMAKVAEMGFQGVEVAFNYGGKSPDELAALFRRLNLEVIGIYELLDQITNPQAPLYDYVAAAGCKYVTFGISPCYFENDPFEKCVDLCRRCLDIIRGKGYLPLYHAHTHEFVKKDGAPSLLERLFAAPQLEGLQLEADTCWIRQAGLDVMPYLEENAARIPLIHAKDLSTDNEVTEIGNGVIDFRPVVEFARKRSIPWVIYEQDATKGTELESTLTSLRNLKAAAGAQ